MLVIKIFLLQKRLNMTLVLSTRTLILLYFLWYYDRTTSPFMLKYKLLKNLSLSQMTNHKCLLPKFFSCLKGLIWLLYSVLVLLFCCLFSNVMTKLLVLLCWSSSYWKFCHCHKWQIINACFLNFFSAKKAEYDCYP